VDETAFGVVPQVGYHVVLSNTWSWWPRLAVTLMTGAPARVDVEPSAPLLGEFLVGGDFSS
jgi:hypothetical protein